MWIMRIYNLIIFVLFDKLHFCIKLFKSSKNRSSLWNMRLASELIDLSFKWAAYFSLLILVIFIMFRIIKVKWFGFIFTDCCQLINNFFFNMTANISPNIICHILKSWLIIIISFFFNFLHTLRNRRLYPWLFNMDSFFIVTLYNLSIIKIFRVHLIVKSLL